MDGCFLYVIIFYNLRIYGGFFVVNNLIITLLLRHLERAFELASGILNGRQFYPEMIDQRRT